MVRFLLSIIVMVAVNLPAMTMAESLRPVLPKAKQSAGPNKCVEPVTEMRKNHFEYILHQRDRTVHEGIRTKQHSFTGCINCHVTPTKDGTYPRHTSPQHFCNACHKFVAVNIDCFMCHNDRPKAAKRASNQFLNKKTLVQE